MRILSHHVSTQSVIFTALDLTFALLAVYAARAIVHLSGAPPPIAWGSVFSALTYAVLVWLAMAAMGSYSSKQRYRIEGALARTLLAVCLAAIGIAILEFLLTPFNERRAGWVVAFTLTFLFLGLIRIVIFRTVDEDVFRRRILVYGAGSRASSILQLRRRSDQRGFRIVAFLPAPGDTMCIDDDRVVSDYDSTLLEYIRSNDIDELVVAVDDRRTGFPIGELLECKLSGVRVLDLLAFLERETGKVKVDILDPSWLIFSNSFSSQMRDRWLFRALDLFFAASVLLIAWPFMLIVALLILIDDGRPIVYRQSRIGLNGRPFQLLKFRSMRKDAEASGKAMWATVADPRVTRVGYWLRKLRLDELPQLINVLRGDMSIVGPRPERPEFVASLANKIPYYHERHYVKPGITGWAQLCYPYGASERDALGKLEYDLYYIKNRSILFYLIILLQTVEIVLWQKGSR